MVRFLVNAVLCLLCIALVGCTSLKRYSGSARPDAEIARVYINERGYGPYISTEVDGKGFSTFRSLWLKASDVKVLSGEHEVGVDVLITADMIPPAERDNLPKDFRIFVRRYVFHTQLKAGYVYQPQYPGDTLLNQKFELCLMEEPAGKSSWWRPFQVSKRAVKADCQAPVSMSVNGNNINAPKAMPAFMQDAERSLIRETIEKH